MSKAFRHPGEEPRGSLATLAAGLVTCKHPPAGLVSVDLAVAAEPGRVSWCAACGALGSEGRPTGGWQSSTFASLLTRERFEEVALLLHAIGQSNLLAQTHPSPGAPGSPGHMHFRALRSSLFEVSRLPIVRQIDRLEEAIAEMPPAPLRT
jgi:hypothetical protein